MIFINKFIFKANCPKILSFKLLFKSLSMNENLKKIIYLINKLINFKKEGKNLKNLIQLFLLY